MATTQVGNYVCAISRRSILILLFCLPMIARGQPVWIETSTKAFQKSGFVETGLVKPDYAMHVVVALKLRNKSGLDRTILSLGSNTGPGAHPLSSSEIERNYLPTQGQAGLVVDYLAKAGFTDTQVAKDRLFVSANGTAHAIRNAFNTNMALVSGNGQTGVVNLSPAQVPQSLSGVIISVLGLQTVSHPHTFVATPNSSQWMAAKLRGLIRSCDRSLCWCNGSCGGGGGGGGAPSGLNPASLASVYGASTLQSASKTPVGIIAEGNISIPLSDIVTYASQNSFPPISPIAVYAGAQGSDTTNDVEWDIDSQSILGVAGGQLGSLTFYVASALTDPDLTLAYNAAVSDNVAKLVNISIGECELDANSNGAIAADDPIFELAIAQGQTVSVASGDSGSSPCGNSAGQSYPATSPYVVAIGGTTLTVSNGNYGSEAAWSFGGGGPSAVEAQPAWQNGVVSGSTRGIPDLAFDANYTTGGVLIVLDGGASGPWGGTSLASPIFVGLMARFQTGADNTMPFPAQWIYHYPTNKRSLAFHDITTGSNGYSAGPGWDFATGFGSFNAAATRANLNVLPLAQIVDYLLGN